MTRLFDEMVNRKQSKRLIKFLLSLILPILVLQPAAFAQQTNKNLTDYLARAEAYGFSGQVLIAEKGKILLNRGYGLAVRNPPVPITAQTIFDLASLTKQFTAAAILRLEMDGKLKTSDSISRHFDNVPADKSSITIQQLLTHTSGIRREVLQNSSDEIVSRDEMVKRVLESPLIAKPDEKFIYSNAAYHLLGAIIEKKSRQNFSDYLTQYLFKPAGMNSTFSQTDYQRKKSRAAYPYNEWKELSEFYNRPVSWHFFGPSGISSTTEDIYKWTRALENAKVLSKEAKEKFLARQKPLEEGVFYGYGWFVEKSKSSSHLISSGGDLTGYHSEFRWEVDNRRLIIILTNQDIFGLIGGAVQKRVIADNLEKILANEEYKQPPDFVKLSAKDLKQYEGEYKFSNGEKLKIWSNGNYLNIGAEGQEVINAVAGYEGERARKYSEAGDLTKFILESISQGATEKITTRIPKDDYDIYISALAKQYKESNDKLGSLKDIKIQGTVAFPWNPNSYQTYVILSFEKGSTDLFLGWDNGKLYDVTIGTGRPFPLIMPFVPNTKTEFSTFEFIKSKLTQMSFKNKDNLVVKTKDGELAANLVKGKKQ